MGGVYVLMSLGHDAVGLREVTERDGIEFSADLGGRNLPYSEPAAET
jgi:hypothetical protein